MWAATAPELADKGGSFLANCQVAQINDGPKHLGVKLTPPHRKTRTNFGKFLKRWWVLRFPGDRVDILADRFTAWHIN